MTQTKTHQFGFKLKHKLRGKHYVQNINGIIETRQQPKSVAGNLAWEIREAIKGKELDPNELIQIQTKINELEAQHRSVFVAGWRPFAVGFARWLCFTIL